MLRILKIETEATGATHGLGCQNRILVFFRSTKNISTSPKLLAETLPRWWNTKFGLSSIKALNCALQPDLMDGPENIFPGACYIIPSMSFSKKNKAKKNSKNRRSTICISRIAYQESNGSLNRLRNGGSVYGNLWLFLWWINHRRIRSLNQTNIPP